MKTIEVVAAIIRKGDKIFATQRGCTLVHDALHLNEHEAARWLDMKDIHSVNWLPADEILFPLIEKEIISPFIQA